MNVRTYLNVVGSLVIGAFGLAAAHAFASADTVGAPRTSVSLDTGWRFHLGAAPDAVNPDYDDHDWASVNVPHDYVIEGKFDPLPPAGTSPHSYKNHAFLPTQPACYRRIISIPAAAQGRRLWLEFDGVFSDSHYWLNGHPIGSQYSGYTSSHFDITDVAKVGADNVLTVSVNPHYDGWWYEGGGIYRHVRLVIFDPVHIAPWGVFVTPTVADPGNGQKADAVVGVSTDVSNESGAAVDATIESDVLDADGKQVAVEKSAQSVGPGAEAKIAQKIALPQASLWSPDHPYLYQLRSSVLVVGNTVDQVTTPFGVRQVRFDPAQGFFLNGKHLKIQGVNCHEDHAGVGVAMPDRLIEWRLERLKELGCNAIRFSHNPVEPVMADDCDRLGFLVIAENRHMGDGYADQTQPGMPSVELHDLSALIQRDRNHPSIILWSLANEQNSIQGIAAGATILKPMRDRVNELDGTRPVTAAMNNGWNNPEGFSGVIDLIGINYSPYKYKEIHETYPQKPLIATEIASELSTRGVYDMNHWANFWGDKEKGHLAAYSINRGCQTAEEAWPPVAANDYIAGGFVWAGFDYKGEPSPFEWPCINSNYGIMDICGFPKDSYYYYKACWTDKPVLHLFPHWNWAGKEGQEIPVWVHTNCQEVELFLNDISLGKQEVKPGHHVEWKVKYAPGVLKAVGLFHGQPMTEEVSTTGAPARVVLEPDRTDLAADGADLSVITVKIVDAKGVVVPTASDVVHFSIGGGGTLLGVGNGDPSCHEPDKADQRSAFNGLCQALVQTNRAPGSITVTATADGLQPATITLNAK